MVTHTAVIPVSERAGIEQKRSPLLLILRLTFVLSSSALVFDTTSPSAKACATGAGSVGRPSEPRLASPRHGTLTPGRISVGRPHCLIPISVGAVTGRKYHYRLFRSLQAVCQNCFKDKFFSLCTFDVILLTDTLTICRWSWRIFLCAFPFGLNN